LVLHISDLTACANDNIDNKSKVKRRKNVWANMLSDSSRLMDTENFIHDHVRRKKSPWRIVYTNKIIQAAGQQEERDSKLSSSSYCFLGRRKWTEEENLLIGKTATIGSDEESPAKKKRCMQQENLVKMRN
jgi:hypothetical protein